MHFLSKDVPMIAKIYMFIFAWVATGLVFAVPFAVFGAHSALSRPAPLSLGARLLIIPGAAIFWPRMLWLWLASRNRRAP